MTTLNLRVHTMWVKISSENLFVAAWTVDCNITALLLEMATDQRSWLCSRTPKFRVWTENDQVIDKIRNHDRSGRNVSGA